jgi:putative membrane protein
MMQPFSESELQRVREAVSAAEEETSGEIVPYVISSSGDYNVAVWRGAAFLATLSLAAAMLVLQFYDGWGLGWLYTGWGMVVLALVSGTLGALLAAFVPPFKRLLAGPYLLAQTVHLRAMQAFVDEEVFDTQDRTGILLFVSLFEHRIEVLGDAGINQRVASDDWVEVVLRIRRGIKSGHFIDGLVDAIGMCGVLLHRKGVEIQPDDTDELSNELRIRKRP